MKKTLSLIVSLCFALLVSAQPAGYYDSANGLTGNQLKVALHNIIKGHSSISYPQLWYAFYSTDHRQDDVSKVWDMYSDRPNGTPPYTYQLGNDQCGNYTNEGDCYNREHSWPQSWCNNDAMAKTDLHHIFPVDGWVNNKRGNYSFGEVRSASWTSQNGSKLGACKTQGFSGTVFEPIDEYKGDFARAIMYVSVRYYGEDSNWTTSDMTNKSEILPWAIEMLMRWNEQDPVSPKEKERNETIYNDYQRNRNPFIDHPEYARMIWDPTWNTIEEESEMVYLFPNPIEGGQTLHVNGNNSLFDAIVVCDLCGRTLLKASGHAVGDFAVTLPNGFAKGCYIVKLMRGNAVVKYQKLMVL